MQLAQLIDTQSRWWQEDMTAQEILEIFRRDGLPHKIVYLYIVSEDGNLQGVVPVRRLLTAKPSQKLGGLLIRNVIKLKISNSVESAREEFAKRKFLAFPVVDDNNKLIGILDIEKFAGDLGLVDERKKFDDVYELLGLRQETSRGKYYQLRAFKQRMPWLFVTFVSGLFSVLIVSHFSMTLQKVISLAFFLTLVLGFNESLGIQSAGLAIQKLHGKSASIKNLISNFTSEMPIAFLLGLAGALIIAGFDFLWRKSFLEASVLAISLFITSGLSYLIGILVPHVLHKIHLDMKVAAGPVVLGLCDICTLLVYFSIGTLFFNF